MKNQSKIEIVTLNYFSELNDNDFNGKVIYKKYGKTYLAHIYVDFFQKQIYCMKKYQNQETKVLSGLDYALNIYAIEKDLF